MRSAALLGVLAILDFPARYMNIGARQSRTFEPKAMTSQRSVSPGIVFGVASSAICLDCLERKRERVQSVHRRSFSDLCVGYKLRCKRPEIVHVLPDQRRGFG